PHQFGEDRRHRAAVHLAVHFLAVIARRSGESLAAADPDRAAAGAGTCLTGALLAPGLLAAAGDHGPGFLRLAAGPAARQVGSYHLVHQSFVEFTAEGGFRNLDAALGLVQL